MVQEIIQLGIYQFKVRQALEMYQAGAGSLGYVAEKVGLFKRDLIREARARGIEPPFDEQTVLWVFRTDQENDDRTNL